MRVLIINQAFYPDVVSTAQHASDLATALSAAKHHVTVIASRRAYDNPSRRFPKRQSWNGVDIFRIPCSGFGKSARWRRALDSLSFLASCFWRLLFLPRCDVVITMTSPPLVSILAIVVKWLKGAELISWLLDINPDEAIAARWLDPNSVVARLLEGVLCYTLAQSRKIIVLDHFMSARIEARGVPASRLAVIPPWSHDTVVRFDPDGRKAFRSEFGLDGKFVIMYSGNHSPCHPLDTLLAAAVRLREEANIAFCFVGGGSEFKKVREVVDRQRLTNTVCIPYQPLERLASSLSSADAQVVVMGDPFVGIVHPCKIYNILTLGLPVLYIGPSQSHVMDLFPEGALGEWAFAVNHGDIDTLVSNIRTLAQAQVRRFAAPQALALRYSQKVLVEHMIQCVTSAKDEAVDSPLTRPAALLSPDVGSK